MKDDFDHGIMSEEEFKRASEEILEVLKPVFDVVETYPAKINVDKLDDVKFVYIALKCLTNHSDAKVKVKLFDPFQTVGSISVIGKTLKCDNPELFAQAFQRSSNFEIDALTNGNVEAIFGFNGLVNFIK